MCASVSSSTPTTAPAGADADSLAPFDRLALVIVQFLILWAECFAASLRERSESTDRTDLTRAFGTTDVALILERIAGIVQRLRALEDTILRDAQGLTADPRLNAAGTAAFPRGKSAPQSPSPKPASTRLLSRLAPKRITATPNRATGPPPDPPAQSAKPQRGLPILSNREAWQGPVMPILIPW